MSGDIKDFNENLTEHEKGVITRILQIFTATEVLVGEYWSQCVARWFPHPEIQQMALTNAGFEQIHISAYDHLNTTLGLPEAEHQKAWEVPAMKARQERLQSFLGREATTEDKALSLAVFSGFTEGVSLYGSFGALMSFSRFNKMKGVGQIVSWSSKDEGVHADAGCWLFRQLISENPEVLTDEFKKKVYQAARDAVEIEDYYIDYVFQGQDLEGITARQLKAFVRHRANTRLQDLGFKTNWKSLNMEDVKGVTSWFDMMVSGNEHSDFFAMRPTSYSKGHVDWSQIDFSARKY